MKRILKIGGGIFLFIFTVFTPIFLAEHSQTENQAKYQDQLNVQNEVLLQTAISEGKVKIIVKLWVPNIKKLTDDSTKHQP